MPNSKDNYHASVGIEKVFDYCCIIVWVENAHNLFKKLQLKKYLSENWNAVTLCKYIIGDYENEISSQRHKEMCSQRKVHCIRAF